MVNPGAFLGSRFDFLIGEKAVYAAAVKEGYAADMLARIQAKYFWCYPVDLPHNEEPTQDFLAAVNDNTPDPELPVIGHDLSDDGLQQELARRAERRATIKKRKAVSCVMFVINDVTYNDQQQIKRWMAYQYMKDRDIDPKDSGVDNPYRALLFKLTGTGFKKPRAQNGADIWRKSHKDEIERQACDELKAILGRDLTPQDHKQLASVREKVKVRMYKELSEVDRDEWREQAAELNQAAMAKWENDCTARPSTDPADRQRCARLTQLRCYTAEQLLDALKGCPPLSSPSSTLSAKRQVATGR